MRHSLLFCCLFWSSTVFAQQGLNQDSLWKAYNASENTAENRLQAIHKLSRSFMFINPDSAFQLGKLQYDFAAQLNKEKGKGDAMSNLGISFLVRADFDSSIHYFEQSLSSYAVVQDSFGTANTLNNMGVAYQNMGNLSKAIECFTQSLSMRDENKEKLGIANANGNIGLIYSDQGDLEVALGYFETALTILEELGDKQGITTSLNNLGTTHTELGNLEEGLSYCTRSLAISQEINDQYGIGNALSNIAAIHKYSENYPLALEYYLKCLANKQELGEQKGIAVSLTNIGLIHFYMGNVQEAMTFAQDGLKIAQESGAVSELSEAYKVLWQIYKANGRAVDALQMYELHIELKDSLTNVQSQKDIIRQDYEYQFEKQHLTDSLNFKQQQEIAEVAYQADLDREANQRYVLYGGIGFLLILGAVAFRGYQQKRRDNVIISQQKQAVEEQKTIVEQKNDEILDSITYAKRIQDAILPPQKMIQQLLPNSFVLYQPKDIVAGDFYWLEQVEDTVIFAAADCTGHGVPGAMVSVVCHNAMNRSVREFGLRDPGKILDKTTELVLDTFSLSETDVKDGMDIALCTLRNNTLHYAGANNPLWIVRDDEILATKADKQPIGKTDDPKPFTTHTFELQSGDVIYIFSDGYVDQFGGEKGKKFKVKAMRELVRSIQQQPMSKQHDTLLQTFIDWKGELEQIDDVCVIGVKV